METDAVEEKKVDDLVDLAIGEEIPETFPGAEHLPPVSKASDYIMHIYRNRLVREKCLILNFNFHIFYLIHFLFLFSSS